MKAESGDEQHDQHEQVLNEQEQTTRSGALEVLAHGSCSTGEDEQLHKDELLLTEGKMSNYLSNNECPAQEPLLGVVDHVAHEDESLGEKSTYWVDTSGRSWPWEAA